MSDRLYRIPTGDYLSIDDAPDVYEAEHALRDTVHLVAQAICKAHGWPRVCHWTHGVPEALLSLLLSFDRGAARNAAKAFLARIDPEGGER